MCEGGFWYGQDCGSLRLCAQLAALAGGPERGRNHFTGEFLTSCRAPGSVPASPVFLMWISYVSVLGLLSQIPTDLAARKQQNFILSQLQRLGVHGSILGVKTTGSAGPWWLREGSSCCLFQRSCCSLRSRSGPALLQAGLW